MLTWIRESFGKVVIFFIVGGIVVIFVASDLFSPRAARGLGKAGGEVGSVNGDPILQSEFSNAVRQQMAAWGGMTLKPEQIKMLGIHDRVFDSLVSQKLMLQAALKMGMRVGDEEVKASVLEKPYFLKDGKFDPITYKNLLAANNLTPAGYEKAIRDEILLSQWSDYFRDRVRISEEEIKREYLVQKDKRNIKYVLLTTDSGKKGVNVPQSEIDKFLADSAKLNLVKSQFEGRKDKEFKSKTFDQVKGELAKDSIAADKIEDVKKVNQGLGEKVVGLLKADKGSDAAVNAILKPYGVEVKSSGMVSKLNKFIPGIGDAPELFNDAFSAKTPIEPKQGGKAKKYESSSWVLVALVSESERPDLAKLEAERSSTVSMIRFRKSREIFEAFIKQLQDKAKIIKDEKAFEMVAG